jgi:hypothetical protein
MHDDDLSDVVICAHCHKPFTRSETYQYAMIVQEQKTAYFFHLLCIFKSGVEQMKRINAERAASEQ